MMLTVSLGSQRHTWNAMRGARLAQGVAAAYVCRSASCSSLRSTSNSCCIRQVLDAGVARVTWKQGKRHAHEPCELGCICHATCSPIALWPVTATITSLPSWGTVVRTRRAAHHRRFLQGVRTLRRRRVCTFIVVVYNYTMMVSML